MGRESASVPRSIAAAVALPDISIDDLSFPEGNASNTQSAVVRLSPTTKQPVTVLIGARPGGTATEGACGAGRDVTFAFRSVTIDPGQPQVTVPFTICGDTAQESDESFSLGLLNPVNAVLRDSIGQVTIRNDDAPPPPARSAASRLASAGSGSSVTFPVYDPGRHEETTTFVAAPARA